MVSRHGFEHLAYSARWRLLYYPSVRRAYDRHREAGIQAAIDRLISLLGPDFLVQDLAFPDRVKEANHALRNPSGELARHRADGDDSSLAGADDEVGPSDDRVLPPSSRGPGDDQEASRQASSPLPRGNTDRPEADSDISDSQGTDPSDSSAEPTGFSEPGDASNGQGEAVGPDQSPGSENDPSADVAPEAQRPGSDGNNLGEGGPDAAGQVPPGDDPGDGDGESGEDGADSPGAGGDSSGDSPAGGGGTNGNGPGSGGPPDGRRGGQSGDGESLDQILAELSEVASQFAKGTSGGVFASFDAMTVGADRKTTARIARAIRRLFRELIAPGTGDECLRIDGRRLIAELASKRYALSRARSVRTDQEILLVAVDWSGSCSSSSPSLLAAAQSLADMDDRFVIVGHSNGWDPVAYGKCATCLVPRGTNGTEWWGDPRIKGALVLGDDDAMDHYVTTARRCPVVWLDNFGSRHGPYRPSNPGDAYKSFRAYVRGSSADNLPVSLRIALGQPVSQDAGSCLR